jgi:two-component system, sensor histidine kinase and response regulator
MPKILVIEDEDDIRNNICEMLSAEDYSVISAENGQIGVQLAKEEIPDLIVCDIMMPELDGYEVLSQLREYPATQTIPFIYLSAKSAREDMRLGMDLGGDDYLTKPFTRKELLGAVMTRLVKQTAVERKSQENLDELRSTITNALPRELRTPLNAILNNAKLLMEDYDTIEREEAFEKLNEIYVSGERLYRLTQNFLLYAELSRIEKDIKLSQALLTRTQTSFSRDLIEEIALQKAQEFNRKTDLFLELQEAEIRLSSSKLKKMVEEILDNAFKFSSFGTPVQVRTHRDQDSFHLFVIDRGCGMTAEQIANIGAYMQFERQIRAQDGSGSGLGLTITRLLAHLHGGELKIESIPEKQTIIHAILPIK